MTSPQWCPFTASTFSRHGGTEVGVSGAARWYALIGLTAGLVAVPPRQGPPPPAALVDLRDRVVGELVDEEVRGAGAVNAPL